MKANRQLTPGAFDPTVTAADIAMRGFSKTRRPGLYVGLKLKGQALTHYGLAKTPANWHRYTMDHLIPLELGGLPLTLDNAWPQLKADAKVKDRDENAEKHAVVTGRQSLQAAQSWFVTNWSA